MAQCRGKRLSDSVKAVVFDMDGTLVTSHLDFNKIRTEACVPDRLPVLEFIESAGQAERERALRVLLEHERQAARQCSLAPGAREVLASLRKQGMKLALLTRNSRDSVELVLERFGLEFDSWVAREDAPPKPSPQPVLKLAGALGLEPGQMLVVGDYVFDIEAGRAAGAFTALLRTNKDVGPAAQADIVLDELGDLLHHFPAPEASGTAREGQ